MTYVLQTASGSRYVVRVDAQGCYWLRGANVPSPTSVPLTPEREWEIAEPIPWPPIVGQTVDLISVHQEARDHPDRMPGGGKFTSPIVSCTLELP